MSNPFSGIITQGLRDLHKNMIDALLEDNACTVPCILHYASKNEDCPNCLMDVATGKSKNIYVVGGPIPFSHGICPNCQGKGVVQTPQNEVLYLMAIWDSKGWINATENTFVQTMSKITTFGQLTRATSVTIDSNIKGCGVSDYVRDGGPEPLGFGQDSFIITSWRRA